MKIKSKTKTTLIYINMCVCVSYSYIYIYIYIYICICVYVCMCVFCDLIFILERNQLLALSEKIQTAEFELENIIKSRSSQV